jgi:hypothetical protein
MIVPLLKLGGLCEASLRFATPDSSSPRRAHLNGLQSVADHD